MSSHEPVRLRAPLSCWHESLLSARTDPLVALSLDGAFIETERPLPAGTPVFLELALDDNGSRAEIDAVTVTGTDTGGFAVRFLGLDDRARGLIAGHVDAIMAERAAAERAAAARAEAERLAAEEAEAARVAAEAARVAAEQAEAARVAAEQAEAERLAAEEAEAARVAAEQAESERLAAEEAEAERVEAEREEAEFQALLERQEALRRAREAETASEPAPVPAPTPAPEPVVESVVEETARYLIASGPVPVAPAAVSGLAAAPVDVEETQKWTAAPAAPAALAPAALAPSRGSADIDETRPWIVEKPVAPAASPPPPPPPLPAPALSADVTARWSVPRTPTPAPRLPTPGAFAPTLPPLSTGGGAPMPRMASLDVPGATNLPAIENTMRWPTARVRVADAPLELPVNEVPFAQPPDLDEESAPSGRGLDAVFPDVEPGSAATPAAPFSDDVEPVAAFGDEAFEGIDLETTDILPRGPAAHHAVDPFASLADTRPGHVDDEPLEHVPASIEAPLELTSSPALAPPPDPLAGAFSSLSIDVGDEDDGPTLEMSTPPGLVGAVSPRTDSAAGPSREPFGSPPESLSGPPSVPDGPAERAVDMFGSSGGLLGADDDLGVGGGGVEAFGVEAFGVEVTDPHASAHAVATTEDLPLSTEPPGAGFGGGFGGGGFDGLPDDAAHELANQAGVPTVDEAEAEPPSEPAMELVELEELHEYQDVLGAPVPAPAVEAPAIDEEPETLEVTARMPRPLADSLARQAVPSGDGAAVMPPPLVSREPPPNQTQPYLTIRAADLVVPPPPSPTPPPPPLAPTAAPPARTTDPFFQAFDVDAVAVAAAPSSAPRTPTPGPNPFTAMPATPGNPFAASPVNASASGANPFSMMPSSSPSNPFATPPPMPSPVPPPLPPRPAPTANPFAAQVIPATNPFAALDVASAAPAPSAQPDPFAVKPATNPFAGLPVVASPAHSVSTLLGNEPAAPLPTQADESETFFDDLAFSEAEAPPSSSVHQPAAWQVVAPADEQNDEDDLPLIVGAQEPLPVVVGSASDGDAPAGWVVGEPAKK